MSDSTSSSDAFNPGRFHLRPTGKAWWQHFKALLEEQLEWPNDYLFKFIVPQVHLKALQAVLHPHSLQMRASSTGKYVSVSTRITVQTSDEIIAIYQAASEVEGVISL